MIIDRDKLTEFATKIFESIDTPEDKARETAEHLVEANLKGHDSHGVGMDVLLQNLSNHKRAHELQPSSLLRQNVLSMRFVIFLQAFW